MCFYYKKNPARSMRYKNRTQCFSWNLYYICKVLNGNLQNLNLAGRSRDITPELKNLKSKGKLGLLFMIPPGLAYNIKMIRRRGSWEIGMFLQIKVNNSKTKNGCEVQNRIKLDLPFIDPNHGPCVYIFKWYALGKLKVLNEYWMGYVIGIWI